jgi:MFS family permease
MFFALVVILLKPGGLGVMIVGGFLSFVGFILGTISGIVLLVFAFQQSVFWGLAYLFIPFAALVFVIMHWQICRKAFLASLLGAILALSGVGLLVFGFHQKAPKEQFKFKSSTQSIPQFSPRRTEIPDIPHI